MPFRVRVGYVGLGRYQCKGARRERRFDDLLLPVNNVDGKRLIAIRAAWQRHHDPIAVTFGFHRLSVDVAAPEVSAGGQLELLELLIVVLHHERRLSQHFARLGENRRQLGAIRNRGEHRDFVEPFHVEFQIVLRVAVLIGQQHRTSDQAAVSRRQVPFHQRCEAIRKRFLGSA